MWELPLTRQQGLDVTAFIRTNASGLLALLRQIDFQQRKDTYWRMRLSR